jgi:acyl carrier protein
MDRDEAGRLLRQFVVEDTCIDDHAFTDSTPLFEAGILDSVSLVSLVAFCEEQLNCRIPVEEITYEAFRSIDTMAERVVSRWAK